MEEINNPALGMILFALFLVCGKYFLPDTKNIFFSEILSQFGKKLADKWIVWGTTKGSDYIVFEKIELYEIKGFNLGCFEGYL